VVYSYSIEKRHSKRSRYHNRQNSINIIAQAIPHWTFDVERSNNSYALMPCALSLNLLATFGTLFDAF
jgi:hypothetical protein